MKRVVDRTHMFRVIRWYSEKLAEEFLNRPLTPLTQYKVKQRLLELQGIMRARETHPAWHIPLEASFDYKTNSILLDIENPEGIEFID